MGLLMGLLVTLGLLVWMTGHWFGRAVVFLALAAAFGLLGAVLGVRAGGESPNGLIVALFAIGGIGLAWIVAGIPMYYWQRHGVIHVS